MTTTAPATIRASLLQDVPVAAEPTSMTAFRRMRTSNLASLLLKRPLHRAAMRRSLRNEKQHKRLGLNRSTWVAVVVNERSVRHASA